MKTAGMLKGTTMEMREGQAVAVFEAIICRISGSAHPVGFDE